jgi:hypothetical protein
MKIQTLRLSDELFERIQADAEKRDLPISDWFRRAADVYLKASALKVPEASREDTVQRLTMDDFQEAQGSSEGAILGTVKDLPTPRAPGIGKIQ